MARQCSHLHHRQLVVHQQREQEAGHQEVLSLEGVLVLAVRLAHRLVLAHVPDDGQCGRDEDDFHQGVVAGRARQARRSACETSHDTQAIAAEGGWHAHRDEGEEQVQVSADKHHGVQLLGAQRDAWRAQQHSAPAATGQARRPHGRALRSPPSEASHARGRAADARLCRHSKLFRSSPHHSPGDRTSTRLCGVDLQQQHLCVCAGCVSRLARQPREACTLARLRTHQEAKQVRHVAGQAEDVHGG